MASIYRTLSCCVTAFLLSACAIESMLPQKKEPQTFPGATSARNNNKIDTENKVPNVLSMAPMIPSPSRYQKESSHTVVVNKVPVQELLFSLARDAKINIDITNDVSGQVTLNAIDQPLTAILERLTTLANIRYQLKGDSLRISKDSPYLHTYKVGYLNVARNSESKVYISTEISSTGQGAGGETSDSENGNSSLTAVSNVSRHDLWSILTDNIAAIIEQSLPSSSEAGGAGSDTTQNSGNENIIVNKESGIVAVRATYQQHKEIRRFIDEVLHSAQRQVMIEATVAEVSLNDSYQAGINWSFLRNELDSTTNIIQDLTDLSLRNPPSFTFNLIDNDFGGDVLQTTLTALESFGDVSIMSSPRVMALNNQTALLKVVDNLVYFIVDVFVDTDTSADGQNNSVTTFETEVNTLPVGFVMSVTPFIDEDDYVTLNVRPTISRVIGQARDPNPALAAVNTVSEIPIIQVREVESVLKVANGDIAVMGGLMQDVSSKQKQGVPFLSRIPIIGSLFRYDDDSNRKTELVIFIKPVIVRNPNIDNNFKEYRRFLSRSQKDEQ